MDIAVFAGYDVLADRSPDHIKYVRSSFEQAVRVGVGYIILIGGRTNPRYMALTEAEANMKIIDNCSLLMGTYCPTIIVLPVGNTAAEGLIAVKKWIADKPINLLFLCAEQSRLTNFQLDALQVGLLVLSETTMTYGHNFPESKDNFKAERRKVLLHCLSHRHWFWERIRLILQKRHQRKVIGDRKILKQIRGWIKGRK